MTARLLPAMTQADVERFWAKVDRSGGPESCWQWHGTTQRDGRGILAVGQYFNVLAPRISSMIATGKDPHPYCVCHRCDNPNCVNPAHLFVATQAENLADMRRKGRGSAPPRNIFRGERQWNTKLTEEQVLEMRRLRADEGLAFKVLGRRFGVHAMTARRAVRGIDWKHVGGVPCVA